MYLQLTNSNNTHIQENLEHPNGVYDKAEVLSIEKYDISPTDNSKTKRIIMKLKYSMNLYYLDVTNQLRKYGVGYNCDIQQLQQTLPSYVYASFFDSSFRISKTCMKAWMERLTSCS